MVMINIMIMNIMIIINIMIRIIMLVINIKTITCSLGPSKTIVTRTPSSSPEPPGRGRKCISELTQDLSFQSYEMMMMIWVD